MVVIAWHPRCLQSRQLGINCQHAAYHGIGCDEYAEIVDWVGPHCQICGIHESDTPRGEIVLDHFDEPDRGVPHKIRGMLCDKCNALMAKVDGRKKWGDNRLNEAAARRYLATAWYLTHPVQPPHRAPDEITSDVKFGFFGSASTARIHSLRKPWIDGVENRALCGNRLWLPAHPDVVPFYQLCLACQKKETNP